LRFRTPLPGYERATPTSGGRTRMDIVTLLIIIILVLLALYLFRRVF
jgi:flagellar biogenesis protein FliO